MHFPGRKKWLFRVASAVGQGAGHVYRSLVLAKAWKDDIVFCLDQDTSYVDIVKDHGYDVIFPDSIEESYDGIYLDVYSTEDFDLFRAKTSCLVLIEGFKDFYDKADIYIRPFAGSFTAHNDALLLEGLDYALIDSRYNLPSTALKNNIERIAICMGGYDSQNTTQFILEALNAWNQSFHVDVVMGSSAKHLHDVRKYLETQFYQSYTLHVGLPHLVDIYGHTDILFSSGGGTAIEAVVAKTPVIITSFAQDQKTLATELSHKQLAYYMGEFKTIQTRDVTNALNAMMPKDKREKMLNNSMNIDTNGAARISDAVSNFQNIV